MSSDYPFVSVIVPVYNGESSIGETVKALLVQDYPKSSYEIIVVDNGSTDGTQDIVRQFPVTLLSESVRSSYAARNRGIAGARGQVFAFTDADCVPDISWLSNGMSFLHEHHLEVLGGNVQFTFSQNPTAAEYADALINIDNESSVRDRGTAATANVIARRSVFDWVGIFDPTMQSGGDGHWTSRVTRAGIRIGYADDAVVYHPARRLRELVRKHVRIGSGSTQVWTARGKGIPWQVAAFCYLLTPLFLARLPKRFREKGWSWSTHPILRIMMVVYLCKLATAWGIVSWHILRRQPRT